MMTSTTTENDTLIKSLHSLTKENLIKIFITLSSKVNGYSDLLQSAIEEMYNEDNKNSIITKSSTSKVHNNPKKKLIKPQKVFDMSKYEYKPIVK